MRSAPIAVWDLPTRLFHWLLVATVLFALSTGLWGPIWWLGWHMIAGYVVAGLLLFRLVWGVHGSPFSRFASFAYRPRQMLTHFAGLLRRQSGHYLGHNPSGAGMIFALLGTLGLLVVTGFVQQAGVEKQGPLAGIISYAAGSAVRPVHQLAAYLLLLLIAGHLAGVLLSSWLFREPLVAAMIHGRKLAAPGDCVDPPARPAAAALWLALLAASIAGGLILLSRLPALGMPTMPPNPAMSEECGACHHPFHPSLLPRAAWAQLMAGLGDHFGEDASLPPARRDAIAAYLERYAAEAWDSKAAHRFAAVAPENPISIIATPGWRRIHRHIDPTLFRLPAVKLRSNCIACHHDADSGRFAPQDIAIPQ